MSRRPSKQRATPVVEAAVPPRATSEESEKCTSPMMMMSKHVKAALSAGGGVLGRLTRQRSSSGARNAAGAHIYQRPASQGGSSIDVGAGYSAVGQGVQVDGADAREEEEEGRTRASFWRGGLYLLLAVGACALLRYYFTHDALGRIGERAEGWRWEPSTCSAGLLPAKVSRDTGAMVAPGLGLSHAEVHGLTKCWGQQFEAVQESFEAELEQAALLGAAQTPAYEHLLYASALLFVCAAVWAIVYLELFAAAVRKMLWLDWLYTEVLMRADGVQKVLLLAVIPTLARGVLLHLDLEALCASVARQHHTFYAQVQSATVFAVHVPSLECRLQKHPSLDLWGVGGVFSHRLFTFFFIIPMLKVLQQAWFKSKKELRERKDAKNRYCDVVNFSVNMFLQHSGGGGGGGGGGHERSLKFRTLCEMPTSTLVHNWVILQQLKEASRHTTQRYPLLHTLDINTACSVNMLCLNQISELVGADFFAMNDETADCVMQDYCFALTCERYDDDGWGAHEDKLRCMIVKKRVLEDIMKEENKDWRNNASAPLEQWLHLESPGHCDRWTTLVAMAEAFSDKKSQMVWQVQIPVRIRQGTDSKPLAVAALDFSEQ